jgi:hypothetical protein
MKSHTEYLTFNTRHLHEYVHITPQAKKIVRQSTRLAKPTAASI